MSFIQLRKPRNTFFHATRLIRPVSRSQRRAKSAAHAVAVALLLGLVAESAAAATYYVATNGDNRNDGSFSFPFSSIRKAMTEAVAGDEILILGGTYRESITVNLNHHGAPGAYLTLAPYDGESVVIKGSDEVTGWVRHNGNVWKKTEWQVNSQQVFDDGQPLQQIGMPSGAISSFEYPDAVGSGLADMAPGRFYHDGSTLYVQLADNSDPNDSIMEASTRRRIFFAEPERGYIHLKNLTFMHSNGTAYTSQDAAVTVGSHSIVENCTIAHADLAGLSLGWGTQGVRVLDSTIRDNGQLGIQAPGSEDYVVRDTLIANNNYRGFNALWHAGGIKATTRAYGVIEDSEITNNVGSGVWADYATGGETTTIRRNYVHGNGPNEAGIFFEASDNGKIYNNVVVNNERRGIYVSGSDHVRVYNNTVVGTVGLAGIEVGIRDGVPSTYTEVKNNIVHNTSAASELHMESGAGNTSDYNNFYRHSGEVSLKYDGIVYSGLAIWQSILGLDAHSLSADPDFSGSGAEYRLGAGSQVVDAGTRIDLVADDYEGTPRPAGRYYDMGAYERTGPTMSGHWRFDENSGMTTADASGNGNTATMNNGVAWTSPGKIGAAALKFDGVDDFVNAGSGANLAITSDLTLAGWFRHSSAGGSSISGVDKLGSYRLTAQQADAYGSHWQFLVKGAGGELASVTTSFPVSNDQWHHIAAVYDRGAGQLRIYVDGVAAAAPASFGGSIAASHLPLLIGRRDSSAYFSGAIDDIRVYDRALSESEIAELSSASVATNQVVVDNTDTAATVIGLWSNSTYTSGYEGTNYAHDGNASKGGKSIEFTPSLSQAGTYEVYAKWTSESNRSSNTPFDIIHAGGIDTVIKDQRIGGGQWNLLGTYYFQAGTGGSVLVRNDGTSGYVIADAVRFVQAESP